MLRGEHSAIPSTFIKLPFLINISILSIFEWLLKTGFTVVYNRAVSCAFGTCCIYDQRSHGRTNDVGNQIQWPRPGIKVIKLEYNKAQ